MFYVPASLRHVTNIKNSNMSRVLSVRQEPHGVAPRTAPTERLLVVCPHNEGVSIGIGKVLRHSRSLVDIINTSMSGIWNGLKGEGVIKAVSDDVFGKIVCPSRYIWDQQGGDKSNRGERSCKLHNVRSKNEWMLCSDSLLKACRLNTVLKA